MFWLAISHQWRRLNGMLYFCCHSGPRSQTDQMEELSVWSSEALIIVEIILPDGWVVRRQAGLVGVYCHPTSPVVTPHTLRPYNLEDLILQNIQTLRRALHCLPAGITRGSSFLFEQSETTRETRQARPAEARRSRWTLLHYLDILECLYFVVLPLLMLGKANIKLKHLWHLIKTNSTPSMDL